LREAKGKPERKVPKGKLFAGATGSRLA